MKKLAIIVCALTLGWSVETRAEEDGWVWSPIGLGIVAPAQIPWMSSHVYGLRLGGLFGYNQDVYGLDIGLGGSYAAGNEAGFETGLFNVVKGDFAGLQIGGLNYDASIFAGAEFGLVNWNGLAAYGFQLGLGNVDQRTFDGIGFGGVNYTDSLTGAQFGGVNLANKVTGIQVGVVNACDEMCGFQIGLINVITTSKLPIMVIANAQF